MANLEEATVLLEQAISSLEMVHNFGTDIANLDDIIKLAMRRVTTAQEIIEAHLGPKHG